MAHRIPVSADDSQDPLNRMRVFQLAGELIPDCFRDARLVRAEPITEEIAWYKSATPILGETTVKDRRDRLEEMRRMLLAIIPRERGRTMK
jgi:hypothetical protein